MVEAFTKLGGWGLRKFIEPYVIADVLKTVGIMEQCDENAPQMMILKLKFLSNLRCLLHLKENKT